MIRYQTPGKTVPIYLLAARRPGQWSSKMALKYIISVRFKHNPKRNNSLALRHCIRYNTSITRKKYVLFPSNNLNVVVSCQRYVSELLR